MEAALVGATVGARSVAQEAGVAEAGAAREEAGTVMGGGGGGGGR